MSRTVGRWRASYTPGSWLVLCGPTTAVVLEPADASWAGLVETLWTEVVAAGSIGELASRLAAYRIDTMPSFAAFFWGPDGMRSLVRGQVRVCNPDTDEIVAEGAGVQTWTEVGLGGLLRVRVDLPGDPDPAAPALPLVVGVVTASSLSLDASAAARLTSPQAADLVPDVHEDTQMQRSDADLDPADADLDPADSVELVDGPPTQLIDPFADEQSEHENAETRFVPVSGDLSGGPAPDPGAAVEDRPTVPAVLCPDGHPNRPGASSCRICGTVVESQPPAAVPVPVLAVLRASNGSVVAVDRAVVVGRAPSAERASVADPELLVLSSPSHDISRTHLEIAPSDWQVTLTDLHSTNGTLVTTPDGTVAELVPGEPTVVELGSAIELADGVSVLIDFPQ